MREFKVSIVIPTYCREVELLNTIESLLLQSRRPDEILVVDQTVTHSESVATRLARYEQEQDITWIRLPQPSIPGAMNAGLVQSNGEIVLFVDDDVKPDSDLVANHLGTHMQQNVALVAGRVVQPWENKEMVDQGAVPGSKFNSINAMMTDEFPGGNFSVKRTIALNLGGFDENFLFAAYHYEREFADRLQSGGYRIYYQPSAWLHHLHATAGGVRSYGEHLSTARPGHSIGAYYYILTSGLISGKPSTRKILNRLLGSFTTRFHLYRPWYIPVTLLAEITGLIRATGLYNSGQKLLKSDPDDR